MVAFTRKAIANGRQERGCVHLVTVTLTVTLKNQNAKPALAVAFKQQFCSPRPTKNEPGVIREKPGKPLKKGFPGFFYACGSSTFRLRLLA